MNRIRYFDSLRLISFFIVYATHFIVYFNSPYASLWTTPPTSYILYGVSGKLGVAIFAVLLGYFAYLSKDTDFTHYALKRYSFFVLSGLVINTAYMIVGYCVPGYQQFTFQQVLNTSLSLEDTIFATFWCIPAFFRASLISYANGKAKASSVIIVLEIVILCKLGLIWESICLMGNLVARYKLNPHPDILKYRVVRIMCWVALFFAIKRPESTTTYLIYGISCTIMLILIMRGNIVQTILNNKFMALLGKQAMAIYIIHPLTYMLIGPLLFELFGFLPYGWSFLISLIVCFAIIVLISFPIMWIINTLTEQVLVLANKIQTSSLYQRLFAIQEQTK